MFIRPTIAGPVIVEISGPTGTRYFDSGNEPRLP